MQKKRNIRFKAIDIAIIILCLACSSVSAIAFYQVYNRTLSKISEEPIGTLIFKQRTAQRRFADRFVWDRLRQSSPLYNGDTIRTIELSGAVIALKNETARLTIFENTMIKLFYNDKEGATVDFSVGNLEVDSGLASVTITSGTSVITVEGQADFIKSEEGLSFSVLEGSVNFDGEEIEAGEILSINPDGEISEKTELIIESKVSSAVREFSLAARSAAEPASTETETAVPRISESQALAESLSTATFLQLPVIASSGWNPNADPASASRVSTRKGEIDGQEKEIVSIEVNIPNLSPGEPRWAGAVMNDDSFTQRLKTGTGIKFKVLGDGKEWIVIIPTSDIRAGGPTFRYPVSTRNNRVVEVNIPFAELKQPDWGPRATFNKLNITNLIFERNDSHTEGRADIKIFDIEIY